jgi:epoxyqueuosine reductase
MMDPAALRDRIIEKAIELGADDAGVCAASDLLAGHTHRLFPFPEGIENHHGILVIALSHPPGEPALDYFVRKEGARWGNSEGNRRLQDVSGLLGRWLEEEGITSRDLPYDVERNGVFLKDAAVLAGLGVIGLNNLLIHPGYGPRIRFRAHLVDAPLSPSPVLDFSPCSGCAMPCLSVCPNGALDTQGYSMERCQRLLDREIAEAHTLPGDSGEPPIREVRYCRKCEFACSFVGSAE